MCSAPARRGLTATPPRQESDNRLAALIGVVVSELTIAELTGRHLAPYDHARLLVEHGSLSFRA